MGIALENVLVLFGATTLGARAVPGLVLGQSGARDTNKLKKLGGWPREIRKNAPTRLQACLARRFPHGGTAVTDADRSRAALNRERWIQSPECQPLHHETT